MSDVLADAGRLDPEDRLRYWDAIDRGDHAGALAGALAARNRGVPLEDILSDLVLAAQLRVGDLWAGNQWSVAREHAATSVGEAVVQRLADDLPEPTSGAVHTVACVEREWHALPALVVATSLRSAGRRVDYLGASATRERLTARIEATRPRVVLLSASLTSSLWRVRRHIEVVRATGTPVLVGGHAFDRDGLRARRLGATAYAATAAEALDQLDSLPEGVREAFPLLHPAAREAQRLAPLTRQLSRELLAAADRRLGLTGGGEEALPPDDWRVVLATFVPHVVDSLVGALLTDDPGVMADLRNWLRDVIERRDGDPATTSAVDAALVSLLDDYPEARRILAA